MRWLWIATLGCGLAPAVAGAQVLYEATRAEDFEKWGLWDNRPWVPGVVRRTDLVQYQGRAAVTVEDQSITHDPRMASPRFEIPSDRWLRLEVTASGQLPRTFFTLEAVYWSKRDNRLKWLGTMPLTVVTGTEWKSRIFYLPPAEIQWKDTSPNLLELIVFPILHGNYSSQCGAWHNRAGRVHLSLVRVRAMEAGWKPPKEDYRSWFEFSTQLLPLDVKPAVSFDFLHHRPAGSRGPVRVHPEGYLVWEDGTPVRLWGVNWHEWNAKPLADYPDQEQRQAVFTLRTLGINFIRWCGIGRGLWDKHKGQLIPKERWHNYDLLLSRLMRAGIYHQFTLWFYDELLSDQKAPPPWLPDEIREDKAWWDFYLQRRDYHVRKWAIFASQTMLQKMLSLQEEIMRHFNPHRHCRYAEDLGVVVIQPVNEVSALQRSPTSNPLEWDPSQTDIGRNRSLPEGVYRSYTAEWNRWLREKFGGREKLFSAYPGLAEEWKVLGLGDADPAKGNVPLPPAPWKQRDKVQWWYYIYMQFCIDRERKLYQDFAGRMRRLGYRNALAGDAGGGWRGQLESHKDLDIIYGSHHPYTDGGPEDIFIYNMPYPLQSPLDTIYEAQMIHTWGKASVVSEWGAGSQNRYRAMLPILVATYNALHQRSAVAEFVWGYPKGRWDNLLGVNAGFGNIHGDPARIGPYPAAAVLFCVPEALQTLKRIACQLWTDADLPVPERSLQGDEASSFYLGGAYLAHVARIRWARWDGRSGNVPPADLFYFPLTSGVGNLKALPQDKKLFLIVPPEQTYGGWKIQRPYERVRSLYPGLRFRSGEYEVSWSLPNGFSGRQRCVGRWLEASSVPAKAVRIGVDRRGEVCWGFYDERALVIADASVLQHVIAPALDAALKSWGLLEKDCGLVSGGELVSATGQIRRNWQQGWITIDTPWVQAAMGDMSRVRELSYLRVRGGRQFGVVALVPLEKKPLAEARRWFLLGVGRVHNRDYEAFYHELEGVYEGCGYRLSNGKGPAVCEPLDVVVELKGKQWAGAKVSALTPFLEAKKPLDARTKGDLLQIPLKDAQSIWMLIEGR